MDSRWQHECRRVRRAAIGVIESLERRTHLSGAAFGAPVNVPTASLGLSPVFAGLADFNGAGNADLYVANSSASVSVLTSNGDGSFAAPVTIPIAGAPVSLATGYFDNANPTNLGIVAGTAGAPGDISVILGNGNGTFQSAANVPALDNNQAIAVGAFTSSGDLDVLTVSNSATPSDNAMLLLGNGSGGLTAQAPFSLPFGNVAAVAVGDFNGDGNLDFAVVNQANNSVSVFLGNGNGTFQAPQTYPTGPTPTSIVVGDFNGQTLPNGRPALDIVTADSTGGEVSFLDNNGSGGFDAPVNSAVAGSATGGGPVEVRPASFSGGATNQDLVVSLSSGSSSTAAALLGDGNGTFRTWTDIATSGGNAVAVAAGDVNHDGLTDVVVVSSSQISALLNTGAPTASVDAVQGDGSALVSTYDFTVTYTDANQIDASTLNNGNLAVTFPSDSQSEAATLVSSNLENAATVDAAYQITFPSKLTSADQGTYSVSINAGSVKNVGGVAVAAGSIGSFTLVLSSQTPSAPTASVDATQPAASTQSSVYDFNVTYTDPIAIDPAATLGDSNLTITYPDGTQHAATLVSTNLVNGPVVHATYQISFPTNLTGADDGAYAVTIAANSVTNTSGLAVPAGSIGRFTLTVGTTVATPSTLVPTLGKVSLAPAVVAGGKLNAKVPVVITNSGSAFKGTVTVNIYADTGTSLDGAQTLVTKLTKKVSLKAGKAATFSFNIKSLPQGLADGTYHLLAEAVDPNGLTNLTATSQTVQVAAPFVQPTVAVGAVTPGSIAVGKSGSISVIVTNAGNVAATGVVITLQPSADGVTPIAGVILDSIKSGAKIQPNKSKTFKLHFKVTSLSPTGIFKPYLSVLLGSASTTTVGTSRFTVA